MSHFHGESSNSSLRMYSNDIEVPIMVQDLTCSQQPNSKEATVAGEFFAGKIFYWLNFCLVLFLSLWPLDEINLFHSFVKEIFHLFDFRC